MCVMRARPLDHRPATNTVARANPRAAYRSRARAPPSQMRERRHARRAPAFLAWTWAEAHLSLWPSKSLLEQVSVVLLRCVFYHARARIGSNSCVVRPGCVCVCVIHGCMRARGSGQIVATSGPWPSLRRMWRRYTRPLATWVDGVVDGRRERCASNLAAVHAAVGHLGCEPSPRRGLRGPIGTVEGAATYVRRVCL